VLGVPIVALANGASGVIVTPTAYTGAGKVYARPDGEMSGPFTVIVRVAVVLPEALLAVTVYVVVADVAAGVPLMTPVALSARVIGALLSLRPSGSAGETLYEIGAPPVLVGTSSGIGTPTV
jgi:hypothetical protein